jgi:hypothetical protein
VEAAAAKYFPKHYAVVQEREPLDKVHQIEDRVVFTQSSLVFGNEYSVNDYDDAIVTSSDGRAAIGELRWNGVAVCLVDHFGKSRYTHVRETAGRRMKRRIHHAFSPEDRLRERIR